MTRSRLMLFAGLIIFILIAIIILLTAALTPQNTNPAFATAVDFINAAGTGDDETAFALLDATMQDYVNATCPDSRVSACIQPYTPPEWGAFKSAVFRRSVPDGTQAWDVDLIATYESGVGFSGVCIYTHIEEVAEEDWRVAGWAGFIHCGDNASRSMALNPDTPNRAP